MLYEFRFKNFLSFKNEAVFSMTAAKDKTLQETHTFSNDDKQILLKSGVIYGANASGKSNVFKALIFMKELVLNSHNFVRSQKILGFLPFLLDVESKKENSSFEVTFFYKNIRFRYGFELNENKIESEWFYTKQLKKEVLMFDRTAQTFTFGNSFKDGKTFAPMAKENTLFLSLCAQLNDEITGFVIEWFMNNLNILSSVYSNLFSGFTVVRLMDDEFKNKVLEMLKNADIGIDDLVVEKKSSSELKALGVPTELLGNKNEDFFTIKSIHNFDGGSVAFDFNSQESHGSQKFFEFSGPIIDTLEYGKVLFVDELDLSLHPYLSEYLLKLFHSPKTNPHNAQLVFSAHDTNLLDKELLRRDQVWFTQKSLKNDSELYSLVEYSPRNSEAIEKNYLDARYGAVPYVKSLE